MIPYISYVALVTAVSFLFYRFLLGRETFFRLNRWFLLGCLWSAYIVPLLHIPGTWSLRNRLTAPSTTSATASRLLPNSATQPSLPNYAASVAAVQKLEPISENRPMAWTSPRSAQKAPTASKPVRSSFRSVVERVRVGASPAMEAPSSASSDLEWPASEASTSEGAVSGSSAFFNSSGLLNTSTLKNTSGQRMPMGDNTETLGDIDQDYSTAYIDPATVASAAAYKAPAQVSHQH